MNGDLIVYLTNLLKKVSEMVDRECLTQHLGRHSVQKLGLLTPFLSSCLSLVLWMQSLALHKSCVLGQLSGVILQGVKEAGQSRGRSSAKLGVCGVGILP